MKCFHLIKFSNVIFNRPTIRNKNLYKKNTNLINFCCFDVNFMFFELDCSKNLKIFLIMQCKRRTVTVFGRLNVFITSFFNFNRGEALRFFEFIILNESSGTFSEFFCSSSTVEEGLSTDMKLCRISASSLSVFPHFLMNSGRSSTEKKLIKLRKIRKK